MNIRTVSTAPTQSAMRLSSAPAANTTSNGPTDSVEPGQPALNWGIRANPALMAGAGFVTTVGTSVLGSLASAIHPVASTVVGGIAGAAVGYHLLPEEAGQGQRIVASGITGMLGAVCGYAGGNTNVATNAILGAVGAGAGAAGGWMIKTAQQHGLG